MSSEGEQDKAYWSALYHLSIDAFSHALLASIQLGFFDIIASAGSSAGLTASEITAHIHVKKPDFASDVIDRILRLLTSYNLLICYLQGDDNFDERRYSLSLTGKAFVRKVDGIESLPIYIPQDRSWTEAWFKLKDGIVDGEIPFEKAHGVPIFQHMSSDPESTKGFNKSMADLSSYMMKKVLEMYDGFNGIKTLVDVGGGSGTSLHMILSKYPHINAINFDLPHVISAAPPYPGIMYVGGDMFLDVPSADAIMMKGVLHDWNDEKCIEILKNAYKALPKGGKVIVVSNIVPEVLEPTITTKYICQLDLEMLVLGGGKERTEKEYKALSKAAGFSESKLACYANFSALGVIEFYK